MAQKHTTRVGDLEATILGVVLALTARERETYGVPINEELTQILGREITSGALYTTLARLTEKELLEVRAIPPEAQRGGRGKRVYTVTTSGKRSYQEWEARTERLLSTLHPGTRLGVGIG
jgi:PadR family transcriptional regulator PadR